PQAAARAELPAVRRPDAPAQQQERRVLVVQPLPGLQGHGAGRNRDRQARSAKPAASVSEGELTPTFPSATPAAADGGANLPHPAGLPSARSLLQRCARPAGPSRPAGREGHFSPDRVRRGSADRRASADTRAVS